MPKRAQGEGSIFQRTDGRWCASITVGIVAGRQKRKYLYGKSQKEVVEKLTTHRNLQQQGVNIAPERHTVASWLKVWLKNQEPPATKPKTYTAYEYQIRQHLIPDLGTKLLTKLQPQDVREFMRAKEKADLSPKTIRHLRATLRAALNTAMQDGLITRNVAALAKPPRLDPKQFRVLSRGDALKLLDAARGHRLEALFTTVIGLGLREGEALGLKWQDIDFDRGVLTINRTLQRAKVPGQEKSRLIEVTPKTERSRRTLSIPQITISSLLAHKLRQESERDLCGSRWTEAGYVFTTTIGTALDQKKLFREFRKILSAAGLTPMRFHDLRHSAATLLLAAGVHPRVVMELLGHTSITMTMNTYSHVLEDMKRQTANEMDAILNPVAVNVAVRREAKKPN